MSNADKALPELEIEFAGEKKKLVFSTAAFCILEDVTGKNALDGETWSKPDTRLLTVMLWAGLKAYDPALTLEEVRGKLSMADLTNSYRLILSAFGRASPSSDEKKSEEVNPNPPNP